MQALHSTPHACAFSFEPFNAEGGRRQDATRAVALQIQLRQFFEQHIAPNARAYEQDIEDNHRRGRPWAQPPTLERLKTLAREAGLWNLFLPKSERFPNALSNVEYAPLCEIMGQVGWAAEVFNCSAPDTGNMETLERYGSDAQRATWLEPLLAGEIRSAFLMTERDVASSDATNIQCSIRRHADSYVIRGRKAWSTGANHERCKLFIVMGKTAPDAPRHTQQSMILVPSDAPGVRVVRHLIHFGYSDAPVGHAEVVLDDVRVPVDNLLLGEGRGFEIAQGRLGPGRVHHCMRSIGVAEAALAAMCARLDSRVAFGRTLSDRSVWQERIAEARCLIDQARALVMLTAERMDSAGNKAARKDIAMIKVVIPSMTLRVIDWAIQAHGAFGLSEDFPLARMYAGQRALRIFDGPDEVHRQTVAQLELAAQRAAREARTGTSIDTHLKPPTTPRSPRI
jgi:acyl-CoA dehydrogenase